MQQLPAAKIARLLTHWVAGHLPTPSEQHQLATWLLQTPGYANAWGITTATADVVVEERSRLFLELYPALALFCQHTLKVPQPLVVCFWGVWLPLALHIAQQHQQMGRPWIQGILGGQGTGKTTLALLLKLILEHLGYRVLTLSLDDLYKTYRDRQQLRAADPRLIWRGPPGTHDIDLGIQVLDQLRQPLAGQLIQVPRFDKSAWQGQGDRTSPEIITPVDIVLFEGWFVGVRPIPSETFTSAPRRSSPPPTKTLPVT
ncbi:hypothetical protein [Neosynechococcus sphagnicola]|uniref:hypothetical protein n=1 Tax=Neosynechococcus sphagnicola TaxID=1501145 RepID=UPI000B06564E|nr:hypothetical protein [Neosynechococcus sphagnicola]